MKRQRDSPNDENIPTDYVEIDDEDDEDPEVEYGSSTTPSSSHSRRSSTSTTKSSGDKRSRTKVTKATIQGHSEVGECMLASVYKDFAETCPVAEANRYHQLDEAECDGYFSAFIRFIFVNCICGGKILRRADARKVLESCPFIPMLERASTYLRRKFGMEIVPLLRKCTSEQVARDGDFVSARVVKDAYTVVIANRDDDSLPVPVSVEDRQQIGEELPTHEQVVRSFALVVLCIILGQTEQCATFGEFPVILHALVAQMLYLVWKKMPADVIQSVLCRLDEKFQGETHPLFGDWKYLVSRQFVDEGWLDSEKAGTQTIYYVGQVARSEVGAPHLFDFAHRVNTGESLREPKLLSSLGIEHLGT